MRPIDADKIPWQSIGSAVFAYKPDIDAISTLDLVPAPVRCGKCIHKDFCKQYINVAGADSIHPITFCSYGKRKEQK